MVRAAWYVLLILTLSGCTGLPASETPRQTAPVDEGLARVVLGIIDSGVNPYHDQFQDPLAVLPRDLVDASTGQTPLPLRLSREGTYTERVQADKSVWDEVRPGTLYWFEGTRILAISLKTPSGEPYFISNGGHGTGVVSSIRNMSKDAWVVVVETPVSLLDVPREQLGLLTKQAEGISWLAHQPWVDIISSSIGFFQGNPPAVWEEVGFTAATREAVQGGKLVVQAAGNLPMPTLAAGNAGPPWIITVGGALPAWQGEGADASKIVDVVSDYFRRAAEMDTERYGNHSGTSFAAPVVAGVLAEGLLRSRMATHWTGGISEGLMCGCGGRNVTSAMLRDALNLSAVYWNTSDYRVGLDPAGSPAWWLLIGAPILPTPWFQMGWGYVGPESIPLLVAALGGHPAPPKPAEAVQYMAQQQALREAYWNGRVAG